MATAHPQQWLLPSWPWTVRVVAVVSAFGAEFGHTASLAAHFGASFWAGAFFAAVSAVEGVLAVVLIVRPSGTAYRAAAVVAAELVALSLISRATGLAIGVDQGPALMEAVMALALLPLALSARLRAAASRGRGQAGSLVAAAMITLLAGALGTVADGAGYQPADQPAAQLPVDQPAGHAH
jgi:hypothetical protein